MNTFSKTSSAKTNHYKINFDDGTNLTRNAKKDFNFAVIFKAESGLYANKWQVWGLASDSKKRRAQLLRVKAISNRAGSGGTLSQLSPQQ